MNKDNVLSLWSNISFVQISNGLPSTYQLNANIIRDSIHIKNEVLNLPFQDGTIVYNGKALYLSRKI